MARGNPKYQILSSFFFFFNEPQRSVFEGYERAFFIFLWKNPEKYENCEILMVNHFQKYLPSKSSKYSAINVPLKRLTCVPEHPKLISAV